MDLQFQTLALAIWLLSAVAADHGAAFRTRATVQSKDFIWISGEDLVSHSCLSEMGPQVGIATHIHSWDDSGFLAFRSAF